MEICRRSRSFTPCSLDYRFTSKLSDVVDVESLYITSSTVSSIHSSSWDGSAMKSFCQQSRDNVCSEALGSQADLTCEEGYPRNFPSGRSSSVEGDGCQSTLEYRSPEEVGGPQVFHRVHNIASLYVISSISLPPSRRPSSRA